MRRAVYALVLPLYLVLVAGCATVGPATVQLSADVGERMEEMQGLHQLALQRYFASEKRRVEDFLRDEWEPLFLKNFMATSGILSDLNSVGRLDADQRALLQTTVAEYLDDPSEAERAAGALIRQIDVARRDDSQVIRNTLNDFVEDDRLDLAVSHVYSVLGNDDQARYILDFAAAAHAEMLQQRQLMLAPIDQARQQATAELASAYADIHAGQAAVTGRLASAMKIKSEQDRILEDLGTSDGFEKVRALLAELSNTVNDALEKANEKGLTGGDSEDVLEALGSRLNDLNKPE